MWLIYLSNCKRIGIGMIYRQKQNNQGVSVHCYLSQKKASIEATTSH